MSIGQRIKTMRIQNGLSIDELAYRLGKNRTTIYRYENGDIENLPLGILDSLAEALNTTPAQLMGWESQNSHVYDEYQYVNSITEDRLTMWSGEFDPGAFSDEEHNKLLEYARFLVSIRKK